MKMNSMLPLHLFWFLLSAVLQLSFFSPIDLSSAPVHEEFIAHAGGEIRKFRYTNSLEALDNSYEKGFKIFELDFELTSDGAVVLLHDWDYSMEHFYHAPPKRYSLREFKSLKLQDGLTQLEWKDFAAWLKEHPDARVVVDVKGNPLVILKKIKDLSPELASRIIPQIYKFSQYRVARKMGFGNIILTLYASDYSDKQIIKFAKNNPLWAVTVSADRALKSDLAKRLRDIGIYTYAHLVDTQKQLQKLKELGVYGVYTAYLAPGA